MHIIEHTQGGSSKHKCPMRWAALTTVPTAFKNMYKKLQLVLFKVEAIH